MTQTLDGYSLLAFLPFLVVSPLLGWLLARRFPRQWLLLAATIASVGAILAVALLGRMLKLTSWGRGDLVFSWLYDGTSWRHVLEPDRTWLLNAVLFVPAGCLIALTTRRPLITIAALASFSLVLELVQRWTRLGVADVSDLVANIVGASAGAAIAALAYSRRRTSASGNWSISP